MQILITSAGINKKRLLKDQKPFCYVLFELFF